MNKKVNGKAAKALRVVDNIIGKLDEVIPLLSGTPNTVDESLATLAKSKRWLRKAEQFNKRLQDAVNRRRIKDQARLDKLHTAITAARKELRP